MNESYTGIPTDMSGTNANASGYCNVEFSSDTTGDWYVTICNDISNLDYWFDYDMKKTSLNVLRYLSRLFKPSVRKAIINTKQFLFIRRFNRR